MQAYLKTEDEKLSEQGEVPAYQEIEDTETDMQKRYWHIKWLRA